MKKAKKWAALGLTAVMAASMMAVPAYAGGESGDDFDYSSITGKVYWLNQKPEDGPVLEEELIPAFTEETGIEAKVVTAGANTYENMLRSEIAKDEPPTLFQIGSKVALERWKSYALDLSDTEWYDSLTDKSLAISDDDGVFSIPYTVEGYGIITNKRIIEDYCAMDGAVIESIDDINNFDTLKAVAEDIQAKADDLGILGAFASTSFSPGEEWRWTNHLFNMPLYYEYKDKGVDDSDTLDGTYMDNFKQIFDLYINNSCTEPAMLSSMTIENAMAEFALEEVAFVQNGNWAWTTIAENNEDFSAEDICFLPIYIGVEGEENQGLCIGSEANLGINNQVSEEDQEATLAFIHWLFNSETGKDFCINKLGWISPYSTFSDDEVPSNPLAAQVMEWSNSGKESVSWAFNTIPNQSYKDKFGAALLEYAQGTGEWDPVVEAAVDNWAVEKQNIQEDGAE